MFDGRATTTRWPGRCANCLAQARLRNDAHRCARLFADVQMQLAKSFRHTASTGFRLETARLLAGVLAAVLLRLVLPAVSTGQMDAMADMSRAMSERPALTHIETTSGPHCADTLPSCEISQQGVCSLSSPIVVSVCTPFVTPAQVHSTPAALSADDLSPLRKVPRIPPRL